MERAIDALPPHELAELYAWLARHRPQDAAQSGATVFEALLDTDILSEYLKGHARVAIRRAALLLKRDNG